MPKEVNEEFIKNLAKQGAKKPIYQPQKQMLLWTMVMIFYASLIFIFLGFRADLSQKIQDIFFDLEIFLILATSVSAAFAASFLALPDLNQKPMIKKIPFIFLFLLCAVIARQYFMKGSSVVDEICGGANYQCALAIVIFAIIPSLIFFVILYRAATLNSALAGFMIGLCGGSFSYVLLRLVHSTEDVTHLFMWHFIPVFFVTIISTIIAKLVVKRI